MGTAPLDILKANVVFLNTHLLANPEELESFSASIGTELTAAGSGIMINASTGLQQPAQSFRINKDRIALELSQARSSIDREYPERTDLPHLAHIVDSILTSSHHSRASAVTVGYNIDLVYEPNTSVPAGEYIAQNIIRQDILPHDTWRLDSGLVQLGYTAEGTRWNIKLEPRFGDPLTNRVFMSLNQHVDDQRIRSEHTLLQSLNETWDEALLLLALFDGEDSE